VDETFDRLSKAAQLMGELFPFLLYRLGIYAAFGGVMLVYWLIAIVLCWFASAIAGALGTILFLVFLAGNFGLVYLARGYFLYMVKAGYIAALTQVVSGCAFPAGMTQTEFAKQAVTSRFGEISAMAAVDALICGVVRGFNNTLEEIASWIPIPGLDKLVAAIRVVISIAANTIDEAILSLAFLRKDQSVWAAAKDGVLLYAQNWKPILKVAVAVALVDWVCTGVVYVMFLMGFGAIGLILFRATSMFRLLFAGILPFVGAYIVRLAFLEPLAVTAVLITYHRCIKGQKIDPAWDEKLSAVSTHFQTLKEKAASAGGATPAGQPA
jgi:hypothetical protein